MKKIFCYLHSYKLLSVISPLLMIGEVAADLMLPYLMSFIVNYGIIGMDMDIIIRFGLLMILITFLGGCFGVAVAYTSSRAAHGLGNDLRCDAYQKVMSLSIEQADQFTTGSLITRMTNDIAMVVEFVEQLLRSFVRPPTFIIGGAIMLSLLNAQFALILIATLPALILIIFLVLRKAIPLYGTVQHKLDKVNTIVQENISGARMVKAYVREEYECRRFQEGNEELRDVNYKVLKRMAVVSPVLSILLNLAVILVIYIGGFHIQIQNAGMTTGAVMAAISYMTHSLNSVMMATNLFQSISRASASAKRISEILETEPVITDGSGSGGRGDGDVAVSFRNVRFHYPGSVGRPVLHDINLDIRKGEIMAIIGATGSGKSSMASLIPRFYDTDEGQVRVDGLSVKEYPLAELRKKIGYVMQKTELFSDTIAGNLRWGKKDATPQQIDTAAEIAQASGFISGFGERFNTYIAEKGASLSGGQKQRISIARALVRQPEILILDDSTSALDFLTESMFRRALKASLKHTTVIIIAQRIASVMDADRIAVLENDGTIRCCGKHQDLMKLSTTYRDIYDSQMKTGTYALGEGC